MLWDAEHTPNLHMLPRILWTADLHAGARFTNIDGQLICMLVPGSHN